MLASGPLTFSPDGKRFAAAHLDQFIRVWDTDTGNFIAEFTDPKGTPIKVGFLGNSKALAVSTIGGQISIFKLDR